MRLITIIALWVVSLGLSFARAGMELPGSRLNELSLLDLEQRLADIDTELEQLASFTLRGGTGSPGYRSRNHKDPAVREWIRIELEKETAIDQVVLVPALLRDSKIGLRSEGFPRALRILAGTSGTTNVVASLAEEDNLLPRIAPLTVGFPPIKASWVAIEATTLSPMVRGDRHLLQLSEIMVFSGIQNVALQKKVKVPHPYKDIDNPKNERFITDGFSPYLMDAAQGPLSQTLLMSVKNTRSPPTLTIDLQAPHPINQINLHTASAALSIPMLNFESWAVPRHVRVEGAKRADFSDATFLFKYRQNSAYDNGPIIMHRFTETTCRHIRITILDHHPVVSLQPNPKRIAFSEIEVLSGSRNVALGTTVISSSNLSSPKDSLPRLTDGRNYYGKILPIREWMNQLARRHDLESARPLVMEELNTRYARQKANLYRLAWLTALLGTGIAFAILVVRFIHLRQLTQMKEQFAADLHDELGANLHTIGLLSDLAEESHDNPEELSDYMQRIRMVTERSGTAVRNVTNLHESSELFIGLKADMQRAAERIVRQLEHELTISGEEHLQRFTPRRRIGLFLFYKECLINICRHSGATQLSTDVTCTPKKVCLTITDNGRGMPEFMENGIPPSLQRRAKLLKAKLTVDSQPEGGTRITLELKPRRFGFKN